MNNFLEKIIERKRVLLERKKRILPFSELYKMMKDFSSESPFLRCLSGYSSIIAEIKIASPSKGIFISEDKIEEFGKIYQKCGASAISVVTEENYFLGSIENLKRLRGKIGIPILRKDFIFEEYQILESRIYGADAILLILSILQKNQLKKLLNLTKELKMHALVEVHSRDELIEALEADAEIIGVNNRNLKNLKVDLRISMELIPLIPDQKIKIVESGIRDEKDLIPYKKLNVNGFLIGEAFLTSSNPCEKLKSFKRILKDDKN